MDNRFVPATEMEKKIILILNKSNPISLAELTRRIGISKQATRKQIQKLAANDIVEYHVDKITGYQSKIRLNKKKVKIRQEYDIKKQVFIEILPLILPGFIFSIVLMVILSDPNVFYPAIAFTLSIVATLFFKIIKSPKFTAVYLMKKQQSGSSSSSTLVSTPVNQVNTPSKSS